jgi:hypothetical protein
MSNISNIEFVLNDSFLASDQGKFEEIQPDFTMQVPIKSDGCSYKSYKYDKSLPGYSGGLFPFFKESPNVRKISDYIVFAERGTQFYILLLELKRGNCDTFPQLKAAKCFSNFIVNTVNRVKGAAISPQVRLISISEYRRTKKGTREKPVHYDCNSHTEFKDKNFRLKAFLI